MANIQYQKGDIFESKAQVIVNTVNCEGFMGRGLALAFKQRYPSMFRTYQNECKSGELRIGRPTLYRSSTPWILNFPTKNRWRLPSKLEYIQKGLEFFLTCYKNAGIKSIAFPKLGTQNGKLSWDDVGPLMVKYLNQLDIDVYIYISEGDREYQVNNSTSSQSNIPVTSSLTVHSSPGRQEMKVTDLSIAETRKTLSNRSHKNDSHAIFQQATLPGIMQ